VPKLVATNAGSASSRQGLLASDADRQGGHGTCGAASIGTVIEGSMRCHHPKSTQAVYYNRVGAPAC
jgi:hypothetical protein